MYTKDQLHQLEERDLISEVLKLQKVIDDMNINEAKTSQIHNYHFASNELLKLSKDKCMGSAIIVGGIYNLRGKMLMSPISITDGLSNDTINGLLEDIQETYDHKVSFTPTRTRLK